MPPRDPGWPFSVWSLSKLVEVSRLNEITDIRRETLRVILEAGGVSWQSTKTWKSSNDPEFIAKMSRVLDLYDNPPEDGRVICVDEFGPLNLLSRADRRWFAAGRPKRLRATSTAPRVSGTCSVPWTYLFATSRWLEDPVTGLPTQRCLTRN